MKKVDQLLIRACKAEEPIKRLMSVYKRFYVRNPHEEECKFYLSSLLLDIADGYSLITVKELAYEDYLHDSKASYHERLLEVIMRKIRYTSQSELDSIGVTIPAKYRVKYLFLDNK